MRVATILAVSLCFVLGAEPRLPADDARDGDAQFACMQVEKNDVVRLMQRNVDNATVRAQIRHLEADFRSFLRDHPQHVGALVSYGGLLYEQQREDEAVKWWHKAVAAPVSGAGDATARGHAYNNLGQYYGENGRAADALRYHQRACELSPDEAMFHYNWAITCSLFRSEARQVYGWDTAEVFRRSLGGYRKARDLTPGDFAFSRGYAEALYLMPDHDWTEVCDAWKFCLKQSLEKNQRQHVYVQVALACVHLEHYDEARKWLAKIEDGQYVASRNALTRKLTKLEAAKFAAQR